MPSIDNCNKLWLALITLFILPISGISIDIYVPSLPAVSHFFAVDRAAAQLTITTYMIGLGIMQLFAGSISDSFGRRLPFLYAMFIYIITTTLVPFSANIHQLLVLRFIQGASVALTIVPLRSIILDLFSGRELQKMMTYMTIGWSIGPIVAPMIGGYLQHYLGWQANFYFLALYSLIGFLLVYFYMPETSAHRHPFLVREMLGRYKSLLGCYSYVTGLLLNGLLYSFIIIFSVVGPFLIQNVMHYSAVEFGHISFAMGLAWFLGAITSRVLIDIPLHKKAKFSFWLMLLTILVMLGLTLTLPLNIYCIVLPILVLLFLGDIPFPNFFSHTISLFNHISGSANALFGASVFFLAGITSGLATFLRSNSALPMVLAYLGIICACLIIFYSNKNFRHCQ